MTTLDKNGRILTVTLNKEPLLEFDRNKPVPGHQRAYLDNMDAHMDTGIQLGEYFIKSPNVLQRSQFVANTLVNALFKEKFSQAIAMCTYLAKRMPDLQHIKCIGDKEEDFSIEFVYDRNFEQAQQEQTIEFFTPEDKTQH